MKIPTLRILLFAGLFIPAIFWSSTIIAAILHGSYNHIRNTVSELGATGSRSEEFMTITTWICTVLGFLFMVGLFRICRLFRLNKLPLIGILGFSIMFAWAASFPSGNPMHSKGGPALLPLLLGPLLSAILWRRKDLKKLRVLSFLSFGFMLLILVRVIPSATIQDHYTGLIQRFVHLGWTLWFVSLSLTFLTVTNNRFANSTFHKS
jgi:hypothetical protein